MREVLAQATTDMLTRAGFNATLQTRHDDFVVVVIDDTYEISTCKASVGREQRYYILERIAFDIIAFDLTGTMLISRLRTLTGAYHDVT